jgi:hypothetical protein
MRAWAHSLSSVWMRRSALPLVRGRRGLIRRWRSPSSRSLRAYKSLTWAEPLSGHHCLDGDAVRGIPGDGAAQEARRVASGKGGEDLGVGESAVVVDDHVQVLRACDAAVSAVFAAAPRAPLACAAADHAMTGTSGGDAAELLDVDVDKLARMATLVAVRRLEGVEARALAESDPPQPERDGREW